MVLKLTEPLELILRLSVLIEAVLYSKDGYTFN
jgi:hypothetical protein